MWKKYHAIKIIFVVTLLSFSASVEQIFQHHIFAFGLLSHGRLSVWLYTVNYSQIPCHIRRVFYRDFSNISDYAILISTPLSWIVDLLVPWKQNYLNSSDFRIKPNYEDQYLSQTALTCSMLTIETLEQGVKYVQS